MPRLFHGPDHPPGVLSTFSSAQPTSRLCSVGAHVNRNTFARRAESIQPKFSWWMPHDEERGLDSSHGVCRH
ncbi:uncharacterized protein TRAVEDRAFT_30003, partial [Trametes versicolor FP-101664 SS1]|uniref:uncharacterized protein n=1 Tax=Trametes versicolor (strain FP-101664) TaxID=717944 RepID=UPI0004623C55